MKLMGKIINTAVVVCLLSGMNIYAAENTGSSKTFEEQKIDYDNAVPSPFTSYRNEEKISAMKNNSVYKEYEIYSDGEETGKILRGYEFNFAGIENLVSFKDLIEAFGGEYTYSPVNKLITFNNKNVDNRSYALYSWGKIQLDGHTYRMMIDACISDIEEYEEFPITLIDENSEEYEELSLSFGQDGYYIDDEIYVPINYAYFLAQKESKMMNFDNGFFNIKSYDFREEERLLDELLPDGRRLKLNDSRFPDDASLDEENFYYDSSKDFYYAYSVLQTYTDIDLTFGYSVSDDEAKDYCKKILLGAYNLESIGYDLSVDYNEALDAYIVYNKDYADAPDGTTADRDTELRLIVVRAYDGKMIYYY
ncbi:MAG: hypothetical protein LIO87_01020 [Eubacterium sp.]|nr:hypothetical protein [Eubacterium sp.]